MRADARKNRDHLLAVAGTAIAEQGVDVSLRDVARKAGVGLATLLRHFPTREALLDALLRTSFDELTARAGELETSSSAEDALVSWLRGCVAWTTEYRGVTVLMAAAIEDTESALHASCVTLRAAGTRLLTRAQAAGVARRDIDGADLFALVAMLAWLGDQPALAPRSDRLFDVVSSAILTGASSSDAEEETLPAVP
ncbi:TetR/AcrR family transcriptional regulator [Streptomyces antarcticus]|uniref:TetR/AcrR family transcriptional regulator n=1 Tax=Streptomyces antarcticus TaxID=2996458 RepID=UPI00227119A3|nr:MULTISPECIES: TetR/AcrR family transcriptional regulator [unclassified Streptomyces]MCY0944933.1 TetR/AcrR family transcriptional regulator [Streptomyces sp. H34-AA3]MCY0951458.1 TetR/AcrR family transcriptional regulator [Streptomyces sp. H27-S2]MCZ4082105.1 TetR/AcrR family transcriptional regulator [Streptomyces sp. H34-S5]